MARKSGSRRRPSATDAIPVETEAEMEQRLAGMPPRLTLPRAKTASRHPLPGWLPEDLRKRLCRYSDTKQARWWTKQDIQIAAWMGFIYPGHHHCFHKNCRRARRCMWRPDRVPPAEWGEVEWRLYAHMRYLLPHCIIPLWEAGFGDFVRQIRRENASRNLAPNLAPNLASGSDDG